nr:stage V sporulation protein AD [uncultured Tyzzerella sp.]
MGKHIGKQSAIFDKDIFIINTASTVGKKEGEGPLKDYFDVILEDSLCGQDSWEKAESKMINDNMKLLVKKEKIQFSDIDYIYAGDLLNQSSGSNYAIRDLGVPFFGIFGACSTIGEGMALGAINIESGIGRKIIVGASSHFCAAEKQFRFPLGLGTQRPLTSTWTVTGAAALILSDTGKSVKIKGITTGKIVDLGIKDANNMGSAMAPAAADVIINNFKDFNIQPDYYDMIFTGDLGYVGKQLTIELVQKAGYDISKNYTDCGIEIFDQNTQDTHSGGSGCACAGTTFAGMIYSKLKKGELNRILFIPTGALMSTTSIQQGESIAGIAHGIIIER